MGRNNLRRHAREAPPPPAKKWSLLGLGRFFWAIVGTIIPAFLAYLVFLPNIDVQREEPAPMDGMMPSFSIKNAGTFSLYDVRVECIALNLKAAEFNARDMRAEGDIFISQYYGNEIDGNGLNKELPRSQTITTRTGLAFSEGTLLSTQVFIVVYYKWFCWGWWDHVVYEFDGKAGRSDVVWVRQYNQEVAKTISHTPMTRTDLSALVNKPPRKP